jgi:hypothetical protein
MPCREFVFVFETEGRDLDFEGPTENVTLIWINQRLGGPPGDDSKCLIAECRYTFFHSMKRGPLSLSQEVGTG